MVSDSERCELWVYSIHLPSSPRNHPPGCYPEISRVQPGTLNLAPRVPEHSKHFVTALSTRSEGSVGSTLWKLRASFSGQHWGAGWLLLRELPTPVAPQRAGPAGSSCLPQPHHPQRPYAPRSSSMGMVFHLSLPETNVSMAGSHQLSI